MQIYSSRKVTGLIKIYVQIFQQKEIYRKELNFQKYLSLTTKMHSQHSRVFEGIVDNRRTQEL